MQIKAILNQVQKFKSFVHGDVCWVEDTSIPAPGVEVQRRSSSRPVCGGSGRKKLGRIPLSRLPLCCHVYLLVALKKA